MTTEERAQEETEGIDEEYFIELLRDYDEPSEPQIPTAKSAPLELYTENVEDETLYVRIDGVEYAYANVDKWDFTTRQEFANLQRVMEKITNKAKTTGRDKQAYEHAFRRTMEIITPSMPREVYDRLPFSARQAVVMDFLIRAAQRSPVFRTLQRNTR